MPTPSTASSPSPTTPASVRLSPEPVPPRFVFRVGLDGLGVNALHGGEECGICFEKGLKFGICGENREIGLLLEITWCVCGLWRLGQDWFGDCGLCGCNDGMSRFVGFEA